MSDYLERWWSITEQIYSLIWPEAILTAAAIGFLWGVVGSLLGFRKRRKR